MIGDLGAARADYAQAYALGWDAEPGNALLLFEVGDLDAALATLDRTLSGTTWFACELDLHTDDPRQTVGFRLPPCAAVANAALSQTAGLIEVAGKTAFLDAPRQASHSRTAG